MLPWECLCFPLPETVFFFFFKSNILRIIVYTCYLSLAEYGNPFPLLDRDTRTGQLVTNMALDSQKAPH